MKYIKEFRDGKLAKKLIHAIRDKAYPNRHYTFMEFCGGHTHAIHRYGIPDILPDNIELIHGPGCPVCVLPITRIDQAIHYAKMPNTILVSYGDMLRVPGSDQQALIHAKAEGAEVNMVYSIEDALNIAERMPNKNVIFFAIGFETTTPPTAVALMQAKEKNLNNFYVFCNHVLTPPALKSLLSDDIPTCIQGFIGPAHVSIIIGANAYQFVANEFHKSMVIAGFEPLDVLHSILWLVEMVNDNKAEVLTQYTRAVTEKGNTRAQECIKEVFIVRPTFEWRGLGDIPNSALMLNEKYKAHDAETQFPVTITAAKEHKACECGAVLKGITKPKECKLFRVVCTPENPLGSCMVSQEGACRAVYSYSLVSNNDNTHQSQTA